MTWIMQRYILGSSYFYRAQIQFFFWFETWTWFRKHFRSFIMNSLNFSDRPTSLIVHRFWASNVPGRFWTFHDRFLAFLVIKRSQTIENGQERLGTFESWRINAMKRIVEKFHVHASKTKEKETYSNSSVIECLPLASQDIPFVSTTTFRTLWNTNESLKNL